MTGDAAAVGIGAEWRIWVDTGGTFTDCLAVDPGGRVHRAKVLSNGALRGRVVRWAGGGRPVIEAEWSGAASILVGARFRMLDGGGEGIPVQSVEVQRSELELVSPVPSSARRPGTFEIEFNEEAPVVAARLVTRTPAGAALPALRMRLGTTRGTNALLERTGAPPVLFITRGFRDLLRIGDQRRPDLFALAIQRGAPLFRTVVEVPERVDATGAVLEPLDERAMALLAARLAGAGEQAAAVALMHAWARPAHEQRLAELLRAAGFRHVSASAELAPSIRLLHRAETAVADAYLAPVLTDYLARVNESLAAMPSRGEDAPGPVDGSADRLQVMTSAGGLVRASRFHPKDSLLSGPAGGVVGAALAARSVGIERSIAFDMGGTSTDVARVDGHYDYVWEHEVGGVRLVAPALAIESVAAGGGSICATDAQGLRVGPASAGASPGPACYGAGGPLTITDANLLLGRLNPNRFEIPLDVDAAQRAAEALRREVAGSGGEEPGEARLLEGLVTIADERMADAIRGISLRKGYDPREYALIAFGGAGPQHACGVAERLGITTVLVPPDAGLLSALGIGNAVLERFAERQILRPLRAVESELPQIVSVLEQEAIAAVTAESDAGDEAQVRRRIASLRFSGQESTLEIEVEGPSLAGDFRARYEEVYGHLPDARPIEMVALRVVASTRPPEPVPFSRVNLHDARPEAEARCWIDGGWRKLPCYERSSLGAGANFAGPALVWEAHSATVVGIGWRADVHPSGVLRLLYEGQGRSALDRGDLPEPVREELFVHRFRSLVTEMGDQLRRTALSVNVRERLDFSCALIDAAGGLVVNAPHIPVHLGALGLCVREVVRTLPLRPGDVVVTNHPAAGGSHLPDVTVFAPVHDRTGGLVAYVATRAHHAEIGGSRPGSMPAGATTLAEEGVIIPPTLLVRGGVADWKGMERLLRGGAYPSRAVAENLADLKAQAAAVHRGATLLRELADRHGTAVLAHYMEHVANRAERAVRDALGRLPSGTYAATERLDDGSPLVVRIDICDEEAVFDFHGSSDVHPGNLNCTPAIVRSVVLYVLRLLTAEPLPLNEGLLRAVEIRIPPGLLNPRFSDDAAASPAVVGGNVETSQRLVDTCLRALRLAACSQGTMNNVLLGNDRFGYYETVAGGAGAGAGWHGADAVHTHMTNTRITDPEILEHRYPVRVERFGIRRGSGGDGRWKGGDGVVRELRFLEPLSLSVLTQHRVEAPYGMDGGSPGLQGRQRVVRDSGELVELGPIDGCEVSAGDRFILETPGGGGWGAGKAGW